MTTLYSAGIPRPDNLAVEPTITINDEPTIDNFKTYSLWLAIIVLFIILVIYNLDFIYELDMENFSGVYTEDDNSIQMDDIYSR
jgi:hypothetical protein